MNTMYEMIEKDIKIKMNNAVNKVVKEKDKEIMKKMFIGTRGSGYSNTLFNLISYKIDLIEKELYKTLTDDEKNYRCFGCPLSAFADVKNVKSDDVEYINFEASKTYVVGTEKNNSYVDNLFYNNNGNISNYEKYRKNRMISKISNCEDDIL